MKTELLNQLLHKLEQARRDCDWITVHLYASEISSLALLIQAEKIEAKFVKPHHD